MKKIVKNNLKLLIAFILGFILIGGISTYATVVIQASRIENTNSSMSADNIQDAIDEIYNKASSCSSGTCIETKSGMLSDSYTPENCVTPTLELGDYVTIVPDKSTYNIPAGLTGYYDQKITPNELTLWRVIKVNTCNVEVVSEYVSSTDVYFRGTTGYKNFVGALNTIASAYENSSLTVGSRYMGYDGQTEYITDTSAFDGSTNTAPSTTSTTSPTSGTGQEYRGGVLGDTLYLKDYLLVSNVYKSDTTTYGSKGLKAYKVTATSTSTTYWLASRNFRYYSATRFNFYGRYVYASGDLSSNIIRSYSSGWVDHYSSSALRPILTLKSGITKSGGSGTKDSPYTLS